MKPLVEIVASPSGFDSLSNYMGETDFGDLDCLMTRNRESDLLTESNWDCALKTLGGESEEVVIHRFGHWACGWWEALAVSRSSDKYAIALDIEKSLADYPVLNEEDWSEREEEEAQKVWADCYSPSERVEYIRDHRSQFEFRSFADLRQVVKGEYFNGYASELI